MRTALLAKQITVGAINIGEAMQSIKGGAAMRNIGQFSPGRTTVAPNLPTGREQGYGIELSSLRGLAAPRGLPADIREKATGVFAPLRYLSPADFDRVIKEAEVGFRQLWKELPWGDK